MKINITRNQNTWVKIINDTVSKCNTCSSIITNLSIWPVIEVQKEWKKFTYEWIFENNYSVLNIGQNIQI